MRRLPAVSSLILGAAATVRRATFGGSDFLGTNSTSSSSSVSIVPNHSGTSPYFSPFAESKLAPSNKFHASVGIHSSFMTACGRRFDPNLYFEVLQAVCDSQWMAAIQKEVLHDAEYRTMIQKEGGAAKTVAALMEGVTNDDEFIETLRVVLAKDRKVALSLCAVQEAYSRLRNKRDEQETKVAAEGYDPYDSLKKQRSAFGTPSAPGGPGR